MKRIIIIAVAMTSLAGTAQAQGILRNGATAAKALTGYAMVRTANAMTTRPHAAGAGTQYRTGPTHRKREDNSRYWRFEGIT